MNYAAHDDGSLTVSCAHGPHARVSAGITPADVRPDEGEASRISRRRVISKNQLAAGITHC